MVVFRRFCFTTNSFTPARSHACTIAIPSFQRVAIGFSVTTCRPAADTSMTWPACSPLGVASTTQSTGAPASSFDSEANPRAPVRATARSRATGSLSQTATSSARSPCCSIASIVLLGDPSAAHQPEPDPPTGELRRRCYASWRHRVCFSCAREGASRLSADDPAFRRRSACQGSTRTVNATSSPTSSRRITSPARYTAARRAPSVAGMSTRTVGRRTCPRSRSTDLRDSTPSVRMVVVNTASG